MRYRRRPTTRPRPTISFISFGIIAMTLWVAGGGSRADIAAQLVVRVVCWVLLFFAVFFAPLPKLRNVKVVASFLIVATMVALFQLIPLPPVIWESLPGHELLAQAAAVSGQSQPWRPLSMVPGGTANALSSLVVPLAVFVLFSSMTQTERDMVPSGLLVFIAAAGFVGLLQFSGVPLNNPLLQERPGQIAGVFANRNHFALLLAMGCALAPVWAISGPGRPIVRSPLAIGLVLLCAAAILATGSRVGLVLGAAGLVIALLLVITQAKRASWPVPRWALPILTAAAVGGIAVLTTVSIISGRAIGVDRMLTIDIGQDMRTRGLPTVFAMVRQYFPWGSGFGSFDEVFRLHEPVNLLAPTYFNHAHNDWLETVLDAGLPGGILLVVAVIWWAWASLHAWRGGDLLPKLGSTLLLFVMAASVFDYPARTPVIMAIVVLAGIWLTSKPDEQRAVPALPLSNQHL